MDRSVLLAWELLVGTEVSFIPNLYRMSSWKYYKAHALTSKGMIGWIKMHAHRITSFAMQYWKFSSLSTGDKLGFWTLVSATDLRLLALAKSKCHDLTAVSLYFCKISTPS
jgi:hypothetical protein